MSGKYALVIGNTEYDDARLAKLTAPGKDAEDLAGVLRDKELCAFDNVNVLVNQAEPTVREAIDEFFDQKTPEDLLLLYFSGHGVRDEMGALYLAVKNTNRSRLRSTAIKSDFIHEAMEQSRSRRQVLILDCCNSGAFAQGAKAEIGGSIGTASVFGGGYGRIILTASDSLQYAWQGDVIIGETQNSIFTHFLVQGLKGEAEVDAKGNITVDALYDYAYEKVRLATPNQTPSKFSSKQEGEIVLRQITRLEQIRAVPLPEALMESLENPLSAIRLGAVQALAKLLNGKNLGLARSARQVLEHLEENDDSRTVQNAAREALEPIRQAEGKAKEERLATEQAEAERKAQEEAERLAAEKLESERRVQEEAERGARQRAEDEQLASERAKAERREKEEAERLAKAPANEELGAHEAGIAATEQMPNAKAVRKPAEHAAAKITGRRKAERTVSTVDVPQVPQTQPTPWIRRSTWAYVGAFVILVLGALGISNAAHSASSKAATETAFAQNTAVVRSTRTASAASTRTASAIVYQSTESAGATQLAEAMSTGTAIAAVTNQARTNYVARAVDVASRAYGASSGKLKNDAANNLIEVLNPGLNIKNFITDVIFLNPYSTSTGSWDYGLLFRNLNGNEQFRLWLTSSRKWELDNNTGSVNGTVIQTGSLPDMDTTENGSTSIRLVCQDDKGILYVNGSFVADLDLSARQNAGDVSIGIGFLNGDEITGYYTNYASFTVWKLP